MNREIREAFQTLISNNLPQMEVWLEKVGEENPEKALMILAKFAEFVLPKLSRSDIPMEEKEPEVKIDWSKLSDTSLQELDKALGGSEGLDEYI